MVELLRKTGGCLGPRPGDIGSVLMHPSLSTLAGQSRVGELASPRAHGEKKPRLTCENCPEKQRASESCQRRFLESFQRTNVRTEVCTNQCQSHTRPVARAATFVEKHRNTVGRHHMLSDKARMAHALPFTPPSRFGVRACLYARTLSKIPAEESQVCSRQNYHTLASTFAVWSSS